MWIHLFKKKSLPSKSYATELAKEWGGDDEQGGFI